MRAQALGISTAAALFLGHPMGGSAFANDRDLRATSVPAASCELLGTVKTTEWLQSLGVLAIFGTPDDGSAPLFGVRFRCGLPVNAVEVSSRTSNDNDISRVSVVYMDSDGRGLTNTVEVTLKKVALLATFELRNTEVCKWSSNINGTGVAGFSRASFNCVHDMALDAYYYFEVYLETKSTVLDQIQAAFAGASFP